MTVVEALAWGIIGLFCLGIGSLVVFSTYFYCRQRYIEWTLGLLIRDKNSGEISEKIRLSNTRRFDYQEQK